MLKQNIFCIIIVVNLLDIRLMFFIDCDALLLFGCVCYAIKRLSFNYNRTHFKGTKLAQMQK